MSSARLPEWEEQAERRIGLLEKKVDKMLDPEMGIYAKLNAIESRLKSWAIALLTTVLAGSAVEIYMLAVAANRHAG